MFFFLLFIYILSLFFLLFDLNIFFVNEELLIFICMSILFILLTSSIRKFIKFNLFFRIEFIYFFFIYLILLNIKLIDKLLNFISLENLKLNSLVLAEIYNFYNESIVEISNSSKLINLFLIKNIVLLLNSNIFFSYIFTASYDFFIKLVKINNDLFQYFELKDVNLNFFINISTLNLLLKRLLSSFLYNLYLAYNFNIKNNNITIIDSSILYFESNQFIKNLALNFLI